MPLSSDTADKSVAVHIEHCHKTFSDGTQGLLPCSLEVAPGEVMALLGPSGCGKTTLLRIVAGLEQADVGGKVWFGQQEVTTLPAQQRQIGMVFQHYALFPHMSVAANIGYGLRVRGIDKTRQAQVVGELLDLVRLQDHAHKRPAELSGGQRQRVALARAVAAKPKVLLLDEPLTALDAKLKESLRDELADLLRRLGTTAIYVTHDQQEAMAIADRLAVMNQGRIVQVGDAQTLYQKPRAHFVAQFLGRINLLTRSARDAEDGLFRFGRYVMRIAKTLGQTVMIRPENIMLTDTQTDGVPGVVQARTFLGDRTQYRVELCGQTAVLVESSGTSTWQVGDAVNVQLPSDHLLRFMDETA